MLILMLQLFGSFYTSHFLYNFALLSRVKLTTYSCLPPKEVEGILSVSVLFVIFLSEVKWEKIIYLAVLAVDYFPSHNRVGVMI